MSFYWRWRRSQYVLTLTGAYLTDMEYYPDFWADVYLVAELMNREEIKVADTLEFAKS